MNRPEPIELENNLGPDAVTGEINRVPWMAYDVDEMDLYIAEKDAEIAELKAEIESLKASHYAEMVDACMRERRLKRALFIAHAIKAKFKWWWIAECKHNEYCKIRPDPRKIKKFTNTAWVCSKSQEKCRAKAEEYK